MAKRSTRGTLPAVAPQTDLVVGGQRIDAAYRVPDLQPKDKGVWRREADKLAWTDPATGLQCIIRRDRKGHFCGFVGLKPQHPLFGWSADAIPADLVDVHGGLDYAEPCDESGPEAQSVCHVRASPHDKDQWWFGFSCRQIDDLVPGDAGHAREAQRLGIEQTYRDAEYVLAQCTDLAAQLKALEHDGDL